MKWINILFLLCFLSFSGCGLYIGDTPEEKNIQGFSLGCLNKIDEQIFSYIEGGAENNHILQLSNCIKRALQMFKDQVYGQNTNEFTPEELRKFIQDLFLQDRVINDSLLQQIMNLKRVIIGGPKDKLTKEDIDNFITFVSVLTKEMVFLQPYIQALHGTSKDIFIFKTQKDLNIMENNFKKSISRLSQFANNFSNPYNMEDIEILIRELDFIFNNENDIQNLPGKMKIFKNIKNLLVNKSEDFISPDEWGWIFIGVSHFISFSSSYMLFKDQPSATPQSMQYVIVMLNNILKFLSVSLRNQPHQTIQESQLQDLISALSEDDWIPEAWTEPALNAFLTIIFGKVFNDDPDRYGIVELNEKSLNKMTTIFQKWTNIQTFLNNRPQDLKQTETNKFSFTENILFNKPGDDLYTIFSIKPLYREQSKVHLSNSIYTNAEENLYTNYRNLTFYNFYNLIKDMILAGYKNNETAENIIHRKEIETFFTDFHPIQLNLGLIAPSEEGAFHKGETEFLFSKMAIPSAKGFPKDIHAEEVLNSEEIIQYLSYAFSIGFSAGEIRTAVKDTCLITDNASLPFSNRFNYYDIYCIKNYMLSSIQNHISNMPDLVFHLENTSPQNKSLFIEDLIKMVFPTEESYQKASTLTNHQIRYMITVLYFIETTINRFDQNNDSVLQNDELWTAFPVFEGYLNRVMINLLCTESDEWVPSLYNYAVKERTVPFNADKMSSWDLNWVKFKISVHSWTTKSLNYNYWPMELDRFGLLTLYSNLEKAFVKKKKDHKQNPCP